MEYILIIILALVVFSKFSSLKDRVSRLEALSVAPVVPVNPVVSGAVPVVAQSTPQYTPEISQDSGAFVKWIKEDWLLKLGGLLLLIGFGWFATYAFMNNWIGPVGRITLGILLGVVILAFGTWRIKSYINQGGVFLVIGSTVIMLTTFAGRSMYDMFTPVSALFIMFLGAAFVALISVNYNSIAVAFSGLVLSFVAPVLAGGSSNEVSIFAYLLVVVLGVVWIVGVRKNWGALIFGSQIGVLLYSLPMLFDARYYKNGQTLLNFAYAFALVFFISSIVSILKSKEGDIKSFLLVAVLNGIFILSWILAFVPDEWQSMMIVLWMIIFAIGAFLLFAKTKIHNVFYVYAAVAVTMLATATAIELEGAALTIAYTIESVLIPVLIYITTRDLKASSISSWLLLGPVFLSLGNLEQYIDSRVVFSSDFFVLLLLSLSLMGLGRMYKESTAGTVLYIGGSVYIYALLWTAIHVAMRTDYNVATTICLVIFTIVGLVKYFYGISTGNNVLRNYGGVFLGLVVLRLLFIDIWDMEMGEKIITFFLVGILLVSTAFISRKIKHNEI